MSDTVLFIWGIVVFLFGVGPLIVAALLDMKDKNNPEN